MAGCPDGSLSLGKDAWEVVWTLKKKKWIKNLSMKLQQYESKAKKSDVRIGRLKPKCSHMWYQRMSEETGFELISWLSSNLHQLQSSGQFLRQWFLFSIQHGLCIPLINLELKVKAHQRSAAHGEETLVLTWIFGKTSTFTWLRSNSPSLSANLRGAHCLIWPLSQQRCRRGFGPWIKCHYLMRREENGCSM